MTEVKKRGRPEKTRGVGLSCGWCGKGFVIKPYRMTKKTRYCSKSCAAKAREKKHREHRRIHVNAEGEIEWKSKSKDSV